MRGKDAILLPCILDIPPVRGHLLVIGSDYAG
jgi:hypothetical protein